MTGAKLSTFGQELHLRETVAAARLLDREGFGPDAVVRIARSLPQPSPITRERLARKILQRLRLGAGGTDGLPAFVRLLSRSEDASARRELLTYATALADPLVERIASDILYPLFVEGSLPRGAQAEDISLQRDGFLLSVEPCVTVRFLTRYAAEQWGYTAERCIRLAMRIVEQGGLVLSQRLRGPGMRVTGYMLAPHGVSLITFVWCFLVEHGRRSTPFTRASILGARFVRALLLSPSVVEARLDQALRQGFVQVDRRGRCLVPACEPSAAVDRLCAV